MFLRTLNQEQVEKEKAKDKLGDIFKSYYEKNIAKCIYSLHRLSSEVCIRRIKRKLGWAQQNKKEIKQKNHKIMPTKLMKNDNKPIPPYIYAILACNGPEYDSLSLSNCSTLWTEQSTKNQYKIDEYLKMNKNRNQAKN